MSCKACVCIKNLYFVSLLCIKDSSVLALNEDYLDPKDTSIITLKEGDTLAVIPPISGG